MQLAGRTAVYVGGFGGIGFAACTSLLKHCLGKLTVLDLKHNPEKHDALKQLNPAVDFMELNLLDGREKIAETLKEVVCKSGQFDVLVNGSGIVNDRDPKRTFDINCVGTVDTVLAAIPLMSKADGGNGGIILNIASATGVQPTPFISVYCGSKHAVVGFTRSCADPFYYERNEIKHISFCPGPTTTGLLRTFVGVDTFEYSKELSEHYVTAKNQSAAACGEHLVETLERCSNGDVWLSDLGKLSKMEMPLIWEYTFKK